MLSFYHFNYQQASTWPKPMQSYFTKRAFEELKQSLNEGLLHDVTEQHLTLTSRRIEPIEIYQQKDGEWQLKSILRVSYASPAHTFHRDLLVNLRLIKGGQHGWLVEQLLVRPNRCIKPSQSWL